MKRAQTSSWKNFCSKQEKESMWDGIYRVIGRTEVRQEEIPLICDAVNVGSKESARILADSFYPEDETHNDNADHRKIRELAIRVNVGSHGELCDPPFTREELIWSASSFNPKKAPGLDGLTADICNAAITLNTDLFLALANKCLELACFPKLWKEAVVVALPKPGKESYTHPKSYRPIGLLPVLGKILEKMLIRRIRWYTTPTISHKQYGFLPQRSTEDSLYDMMQYIRNELKLKKLIVLVSLDIEGAFDNAWWPAIRCRLAETGCPANLRRLIDSYLEDRTVRVRFAGAEWSKNTTKGCVQGSIGGPTLWNILVDPLLKEVGLKGEHCQAFADDVVLIVSGDTAREVQRRTNALLAHVWNWGVKNKLRFAPQKTKAILFTNKLKYDSPVLTMGGEAIEYSREIKILGLTIDKKLTFNAHIKNVCRKAQIMYNQLSRAAKINWGLNSEIVRTIYLAVVEPVILYAASVWAPATKKVQTRKLLNSVQRGFVQKIVKAYRTVSLNSALLLAGLLPLDLRIQEAALIYEIKKGHSREVVGDRDLEGMVAHTNLPHPVDQVGPKFICLGDGAQVVQTNNTELRIFTDGSKIEGKVGAALSIWDSAAETSTKKFKLDYFCTVYQAELLALLEATKFALQSPARSCNIYSDSRSALETITRGDSLHPLAVRARENIIKLKDLGKPLALHWVKAHVGVEGNERADALAKEAAMRTKTKPFYSKCPISFVKRQIRMDSLGEWNRRYREENTAATTKIFFPDAISAYPILRKIEMDPLLTQVLTGHGGFSEYLHRFKCKESPICTCDREQVENVIHLIAECPRNYKIRKELELEVKTKISREEIHVLMKDKENRGKFIEYCKRIAKIAIDRNK